LVFKLRSYTLVVVNTVKVLDHFYEIQNVYIFDTNCIFFGPVAQILKQNVNRKHIKWNSCSYDKSKVPWVGMWVYTMICYKQTLWDWRGLWVTLSQALCGWMHTTDKGVLPQQWDLFLSYRSLVHTRLLTQNM